MTVGATSPADEDEFDRVIEKMGWDKKALARAMYVCQNVPIEVRREDLGWLHHEAVAPVSDPTEQARILKEVADKNLSVQETKQLVKRQKAT